MSIVAQLKDRLGKAVVTGNDMAPWSRDWTGTYHWTPLCVVRPANTDEVSTILQLANEAGVPVVPVGGNTGLAGGTKADDAIMLSLDRMNQIEQVRPDARLAIVGAGVVMDKLHEAVDAHDLSFPMTFGARGSCMVGGFLSTNAGGSNVLRYGNTRDLVLGIEAVLADGRVVDLMSELHKDNSGLNLKHLLIGAEGTLAVITRAVLKLVPKPKGYATATVAVKSLPDALSLLNQIQEATGGLVEAFEFMNARHVETYQAMHPDRRWPFESPQAVNILIELGATAPRDVALADDGQAPLTQHLEDVLAGMLEAGAVLDAVVAQSEAQRREMWARREAAAEVATSRLPVINNDIAVGLDKVADFLAAMEKRLPRVDAEADVVVVSHLGDGNVHYSVWPSSDDAEHLDAIVEAVEDEVLALGGSFSAEHGIGVSKKQSMKRRKNPVALDMMRSIKAALDPKGILNPGKVIPDP